MFRRAWFIVAALWACLMLLIPLSTPAGGESTASQPKFWMITFAPFAVPWILSRLLTYVRFRTFRRSIPYRPYRPRP
jgi:hypothetical protein